MSRMIPPPRSPHTSLAARPRGQQAARSSRLPHEPATRLPASPHRPRTAAGTRYPSWAVRHSPCTTSPGRPGELPGPAVSTGTSRRGTAGHAHRHRRQRNHATCVMAIHAGRREARVDSTTAPYRRIPKRPDPARPREHQPRRDATNHRTGPGNGRASIPGNRNGEPP